MMTMMMLTMMLTMMLLLLMVLIMMMMDDDQVMDEIDGWMDGCPLSAVCTAMYVWMMMNFIEGRDGEVKEREGKGNNVPGDLNLVTRSIAAFAGGSNLVACHCCSFLMYFPRASFQYLISEALSAVSTSRSAAASNPSNEISRFPYTTRDDGIQNDHRGLDEFISDAYRIFHMR